MRGGLLVVLLCFVSSACMTARGRADTAFDHADYVAAADQYDVLARQKPEDAALAARRDDARTRALIALATRTHDARVAGRTNQALASLAELLSRRRSWPGASGAGNAAAIAEEIAAASAELHRQVTRLVTDDQPLGAEALIAMRRGHLGFPELDALWPALAGEAHGAGEARCRAAAPADVEQLPYLGRLTAAYCAHFGVAIPAPARRPSGLAGVSIDGTISGMTGEQRARVDAELERGLRHSPWFSGAADDTSAHVALTGYQAATYRAAATQREAEWTEMVPYSDREMYQEPYQESYQESYQEPYQESYSVQVPHTDYRTETYSCGFGTSTQTCSRSVSSTSYSTETQFRTAYRTAYRTAFRTAYRTAWRTVTRIAATPRTFLYDAVERSGEFTGMWGVTIELAGNLPPLELRVAHTDRQVGYDHDVTFEPAQVSPSRARLWSLDDWFNQLLARLATALPAQLTAHWSASFCRLPSFDPESAARCGYGAAVPAVARLALVPVFGNDVDRVLDQFARTPAAP